MIYLLRNVGPHIWGRGEVHTGFWSAGLRERGHLETKGVIVRMILKWIFKNWDGCMHWIALAQDRER
jgi:hypothetical protein